MYRLDRGGGAYLAGTVGEPERWKWMFCHLPSRRCQMRVSSACAVRGTPPPSMYCKRWKSVPSTKLPKASGSKDVRPGSQIFLEEMHSHTESLGLTGRTGDGNCLRDDIIVFTKTV
ncbi:hypothetical protein EYF80_034716 [Liparis tanakae]|uniref:Uncharacterized protein n=1 Tax=Liparis tanakae TaxID=230148 RepID=A0A4Z2GNF0_9TELE|nr:hypothetical protein EYF80_034716 [Liparis tanakae]